MLTSSFLNLLLAVTTTNCDRCFSAKSPDLRTKSNTMTGIAAEQLMTIGMLGLPNQFPIQRATQQFITPYFSCT